jgi:hypothetical protein
MSRVDLRQTLIALRARRSAHQVAADIVFPHLDAAPPPSPALPLVDPEIVEEDIQRHELRLAREQDLHRERQALKQILLAIVLIFGLTFLTVVLTALFTSHASY